MQLVFHGGMCCGVKTIFGMGPNPFALDSEGDTDEDYFCDAINPIEEDNRDKTATCTPGGRFFHEGAPQETPIDRLDRYLEYVKRRRPNGIVEVVITEYQASAWEDTLLERGFKESTYGKNSNSGNICHIFHLVY